MVTSFWEYTRVLTNTWQTFKSDPIIITALTASPANNLAMEEHEVYYVDNIINNNNLLNNTPTLTFWT